ncbi:MAG: sigma-70 family RNA polymerase sigma factor [Kiritimatiellia bacterium]|nr:sigma-70 family RNA polymerase sigma factor [Kiritimatiellia bacterium]
MRVDHTTQRDDRDSGNWIREAVKAHEGHLIAYANRLLSGDLGRGREAVQDTFLKLCRQPREKVEDGLAQWLFTVCRNRCFEILRKEKRMTTLETSHLESMSVEQPHPAETLQREDDLTRVRELIKSLPERQQEVVRLKFQNGLSYRDISGVTELSVSNVGLLLHQAVKAIRKGINPDAVLAPTT